MGPIELDSMAMLSKLNMEKCEDRHMSKLPRRRFLSVASAGAVGSAILPSSLHAENSAPWSDPVERLSTMIRVLGRTDGGVRIRWASGVLAGVVEQETKQILGVSQQIYSRHRAREDGSFDAVYLELVYFTDLETGAVLEEWNNPYTGRKTNVPVQILGPTRFYLPLDLKVVNEPYPMEGIVNAQWLEPLPFTNSDLMFNERIDSYVPPMVEGGAPLKFHEVFAFRASLEALRDKDLPYVPATVDKFNVISWRPWMDMDEIDGVSMSRGAGRMAIDYDELPDSLIQKNKIFFPDVIKDIDEYLEL